MGSSGYDTTVLPRLSRFALGGRILASHRASLLSPLRGRVLEVGIGSGTSIGYYSTGVRHLVGLDVSTVALRQARRQERRPFPVALVRGKIEHPPFPDRSFDFVVTTWVLCLLPDPGLALSCMRRLLAPGGKLVFLEHGRTQSRLVGALQSLLTPVTYRACGGCHLDRPIDYLITDAGFQIESLHTQPLDPLGLVTLYEGAAAPRDESVPPPA